jgi:hypothetical protein
MNTFAAIDKALRAIGWTFDPYDEDFRYQSGKRIAYAKLLKMVPGTSEDEFAAWAEANGEKMRADKKKVARKKG